MNKVLIDGNGLTLEQFVDVARFNAKVELTSQAIDKINKARELVDKFVDEK